MIQNSRKEHIDKAISHYSSLFKLPTYRRIVIFLGVQCMVIGIAVVLPLQPSFYGLFFAIFIGIFLFLLTLFADYLSNRFLLKRDLILNLRRCIFLSLASSLILFVFILSASLASAYFTDPKMWIKIISFGVFASLTLRFLVFHSLSFVRPWRILISVLLQPLLFLIPLSFALSASIGFQNYSVNFILDLFMAAFLAFFGVHLFMKSLDTLGINSFGIPSMKLFKAFLANWTEGLEKPFEEILEQLSEERNIEVSLIAFKSGNRLKALIVVPSLHPGPFKNVGSSPIPGLIQESLEKKLGCIVSVLHGISGHELDLASQYQNEKVLKHILEAAEFNVFHPFATEFLSLKCSEVTASCQIFGDCILVLLTLAPETMEDLPLELNDIITKESKKIGFDCAVTVDAHNSVDGSFDPDKVITSIKKAVVAVLEKAMDCKSSRFEVGAAKVVPKEFGIKDGMGPGGITVIVVKVNEQKTAYVTIDGNNMVSNLREKILLSLQELGINNGEILTTDTHVVNAVVITGRGYYPIGEKIDHEKLIEYIRTATVEALKNVEPSEVSWRKEEIPGVKVIGEEQIDNLSLLTDRVARKAKRNSILIFPALGILLAILLLLI